MTPIPDTMLEDSGGVLQLLRRSKVFDEDALPSTEEPVADAQARSETVSQFTELELEVNELMAAEDPEAMICNRLGSEEAAEKYETQQLDDKIIEDCKKAGFTFPAKSTMGVRFDRWLKDQGVEEQPGYKSLNRQQKQEFRKKWAAGEYEKQQKSRKHTTEQARVDKTSGEYLNFDQIIVAEGGRESKSAVNGAIRYAMACIRMKGDWVSKSTMTGRPLFLYVRNGFEETFKEAWAKHVSNFSEGPLSPRASPAPSASPAAASWAPSASPAASSGPATPAPSASPAAASCPATPSTTPSALAQVKAEPVKVEPGAAGSDNSKATDATAVGKRNPGDNSMDEPPPKKGRRGTPSKKPPLSDAEKQQLKERLKAQAENRKRADRLLTEYGRATTQAKSLLNQIETSPEWRWAQGEQVEGNIRQRLHNAEERVAKHDWVKNLIATGLSQYKPGEETDKLFAQLPDIFGDFVTELSTETRSVSRMQACRKA